jgi:hypothetical protein
LNNVLLKTEEIRLWFYCPGCKFPHSIRVKGNNPLWEWNGDMDKPTFNPSILCNANNPESRCHSFVKDGKIQFLGDSFHELKNQTVPLEPFKFSEDDKS